MIAQLQSLAIEATLLNETHLRVSQLVEEQRRHLKKERRLLNTSIRNAKRAIEVLSRRICESGRDAMRIESLAAIAEKQSRETRRRNDVRDKLARIDAATLDHSSIAAAIGNLESLWDQLTVAERCRLMARLLERIDHNPVASDLSITLSPTGLRAFLV